MLICGQGGKARGKMENGTELKAVCINQRMEETHGIN